jgi:hypothetical protein
MDTTQTPSTRHGASTYVERTDPQAHQQHGDMSHIPGWGADLDLKNRPAVPMERTPPRLHNVHWDEPEHQHAHVEVLHSIERPGVTPIFGTSVPPSGLSGRLRELAFRWSENDMRHWLMLLLADRINVGEGLVSDLARGHIPNIPAEMGARAEWQYNRAGFVRKALAVSAIVGIGVYLMQRGNGRDHHRW